MLPPPLPILVAVVVGFLTAQAATLATTVYLHRSSSHRAIGLHPAVAFACRVVVWVSTGIKPRQWVAVHRKHHAYTDVEGDPHSPHLLGWVRVQLGNVGLYRTVANDEAQVARYARDLPADRWDRALFDRAWLGLGIGVTALVLVLGPVAGLLAAVVHTVLYLQLNAAVNAVTHTFGRRPHPNGATNLQWLAWLTAGEGLHNNHHAVPTSAKLSFAKGEVDPAWPVVVALHRLGLATLRPVGPLAPDEPEPVAASVVDGRRREPDRADAA
jgi:stearoyl-CoA desaturase (delta-9 desaturase)